MGTGSNSQTVRCFFVFVGGTLENGAGTVQPSQMLTAIPGDRNIMSPEKHSIYQLGTEKFQADFQKPSKLMLS